MSIQLNKEAAVAIHGALSGLIDALKAQKTAAAVDPVVKDAATKLANDMLARGLITKAALDQTVANLQNPKTVLMYVKKAMDMAVEAKAGQKTAAEAPATVGRSAPHAAQTKIATSKDRMAQADRAFESAIGL